MAQAQQKVEYGQIIPAFTLPGTDGMTHSPWNYKQREHLLLLFFVLLLFGISLQSFQIAGGLVLLLLSIEIIFRGERFDKLALVSAEETAVFPIAFPLLVGPGAITLTLISIESSGIQVAIIAIVIVMFLSWVVLRQTDRIYRILGKTGSAVIARIMSLFIAAIAVQYILAGIQFYYPPR